MGWQLVAQGAPDDFQSTGVIEDLPSGTRIKLEADTLPGLAYLANIWGAEWVIEKFALEGVTVTDTYAQGSSKVIVEGYVNSPGVMTIIAIVGIVIAIGGIGYLIHELRLWASLPDGGLNIGAIAKWGSIGLLGVLGYKLITTFKEAKT